MMIFEVSSRRQVGIWQVEVKNILDCRINRKNRKYVKLKLASYLPFVISFFKNTLPSSAYLKIGEEDEQVVITRTGGYF